MSVELIPLKPEQHEITFVPRFTTDLPFFNLTLKRKDIPSVIKYQGRDEAGHPIRWEVYQDTSEEIGAPAVEAHEVWYLLVKPSIDEQRASDGKIPTIIPLGGIRECLRKVGWTIGGHQARELLKALTQISFAGCVADLWVPTGQVDGEGKTTYLRLSGRFSRLSVYAIGQHHLTEEELAKAEFKFDLEDTLYIRLDPLEAKLQEVQEQKPQDNQYLFSVKPAARRWYELMAAKMFGVVKNKGEFCEIRYSWYIKHHHTLKRYFEHKRVRFQMDRVVKDHLASDYIRKVEYRKIKEVDREIDYVIRYYPGEAAKHSIGRIQEYLRRKRSTARVSKALSPNLRAEESMSKFGGVDSNGSPQITALITAKDAHDQQLVVRLFVEFGITLSKGLDLIGNKRESVIKQLRYWPNRQVQIKGGLAGWMISAIARDYAPPTGYVEAIERESEASAAKSRSAQRAACPFCDENGFIKIESNNRASHGIVRLCTHNPTIESARMRNKMRGNESRTLPDAQNATQRPDFLSDEEKNA